MSKIFCDFQQTYIENENRENHILSCISCARNYHTRTCKCCSNVVDFTEAIAEGFCLWSECKNCGSTYVWIREENMRG